MPKKTPTEWVDLALATAEPYGDGCLLATAWRPQRKGYIRVARSLLLHRLVVEVALGRELFADETVDHTCHNRDQSCPGGPACVHRRCINALHLEVVDAVSNWERGRRGGIPKGVTVGAARLNLAKTHCPKNHPYTPENTRTSKDGYRRCLTCHREREAVRRAS